VLLRTGNARTNTARLARLGVQFLRCKSRVNNSSSIVVVVWVGWQPSGAAYGLPFGCRGAFVCPWYILRKFVAFLTTENSRWRGSSGPEPLWLGLFVRACTGALRYSAQGSPWGRGGSAARSILPDSGSNPDAASRLYETFGTPRVFFVGHPGDLKSLGVFGRIQLYRIRRIHRLGG
jgi:hypothetical protein